MGDVLAIAEQKNGALRAVAAEVTAAARQISGDLGGTVHALVLGPVGVAAGAGDLHRFGADLVRVAEHEALGRYEPHVFTEVVTAVARDGGYSAVLFAATAMGRDLAPRVAARLDVPLATDVTGVGVMDGSVVATRPVYAGKTFARVRIAATPAVLSVRPNTIPASEHPGAGVVETFTPQVEGDGAQARFVEFKEAGGGQLDVSEASTVVAGGRGMKGPEHWRLLEELRDAIGAGAALGASRAVVDAGWRPHGEQVGQTGKVVSPSLYFAVGISGAIQHLAGMRTSGTIVAVNKDRDAPIFNVADYGIVGDAFDILPRLTEAIAELRREA